MTNGTESILNSSGNLPADSAELRSSEQPSSLGQALEFFNRTRLTKILILAVLFIWQFHGPLLRLIGVWSEVPDWSHGWLVPAFCIGILLMIYDQWKDIPLQPTYSGLAFIALALFLNILATWWWKAITLQDWTAWMVAVGLVITLCGWRFAKAIWFPMAFFLFAVRLPDIFYNKVSSILQHIAAQCSTLLMRVMTISVDINGVVITLVTRSGGSEDLLVAEACSGMRILMAFAALGSLMAYMVRRPWWHRLALVVAILPIAVLSNVLRITGMGVLNYFDRKDLAEGFAHTLEGMFMLPVAFILFWLLHKLLSGLLIDEPHEEQASSGKPVASGEVPSPAAKPISAMAAATAALSRAANSASQALRMPGKTAGNYWRSVRPGLGERHFAVLALLMLLMATSWQVIIKLTGSVFNKLPVPLRQAVDRLPREISSASGGKWLTMHPAPPVTSKREFNELIKTETESFLGATHPYRLRGERNFDPEKPDDAKLLVTPQYVQRVYRKVNADGREDGRRQVYFFLSYYTGTPDPVPHVPDRCYLGGGWEVVREFDRELTVPGIDKPVPVRCMQFAKGSVLTNVIYFIISNGRMYNNHLKVRNDLNSPFGKYAYYAKVEVKFPAIQDLDEAANATTEMLGDFLPIVFDDILPDWSSYQK